MPTGWQIQIYDIQHSLDRSEINTDNERRNGHEASCDLTPSSRGSTQIYTYSGVFQETKLSVKLDKFEGGPRSVTWDEGFVSFTGGLNIVIQI